MTSKEEREEKDLDKIKDGLKKLKLKNLEGN
jgi:hypothetical protein